jgi:hypothetical protein
MDNYCEVMYEYYAPMSIDNEEGFSDAWHELGDELLVAALKDEPDLWADHAWALQVECLPHLCAALSSVGSEQKQYEFERFGWNVADILKYLLKDYLEELWNDNEANVRQAIKEDRLNDHKENRE